MVGAEPGPRVPTQCHHCLYPKGYSPSGTCPAPATEASLILKPCAGITQRRGVWLCSVPCRHSRELEIQGPPDTGVLLGQEGAGQAPGPCSVLAPSLNTQVPAHTRGSEVQLGLGPAAALEPLSPGKQTQEFLPSPGPDPALRSPSSFLCTQGTPHPNKALIKGKKRGKAETFPAMETQPQPSSAHGPPVTPPAPDNVFAKAAAERRSILAVGRMRLCCTGAWDASFLMLGLRQGAGPRAWRRCQVSPPSMGILLPGARGGVSLPHPEVAFVFEQCLFSARLGCSVCCSSLSFLMMFALHPQPHSLCCAGDLLTPPPPTPHLGSGVTSL